MRVNEYEKQRSEPVTLGTGNAVGVKETEKALLVQVDGVNEGQEFWIPKSCIHDDSEVFSSLGLGKLIVMRWFAEKNGYA